MSRLALLALFLMACAPAPAPPPQTGTLYAAGELKGYLEPCGCNRPQLGGLARRGTALRGAAFVENGDLVTGPGRLNEIRFETLMTALSTLGCQAVNVGSGDLALGIDFLLSARGLARFPLISANVIDERGERPFPASTDVSANGTLWRVVGVLDPAAAGRRTVMPVLPAVRAALAGTPAGAKTVVLLSGPEAAARRLLDEFPTIDRVVFSGREARRASERSLTPGDRGRRLVRLDGRRPVILTLDERFDPDPRMVRSLAEYVRRIREEDLLHRMNPGVEPAGGGYVGDRACATCHETTTAVHEKSRHATAIRSLAATDRHVDPECVTCHVVGYGERTGFTSREETPALARVGCESCHGPGADHAKRPEVKTISKARESCATCHTEDTDPGFRFEAKWGTIEHR